MHQGKDWKVSLYKIHKNNIKANMHMMRGTVKDPAFQKKNDEI